MEKKEVTIEQFIDMLAGAKGGVSYAYKAGWIEAQEVTHKDALLDRKTAARILHQFLRRELLEDDEMECREASSLQDLYACRVCVSHVMQVYVKGIMDGYRDAFGRFIFGMNDKISEEEVKGILQRLLDRRARIPRTSIPEKIHKAKEITPKEALSIPWEDKDTLLVDVRTLQEYGEGHLNGAINIPLVSLLKNPYGVSTRRDVKILLYCPEGYQSQMAADCLLQAGYEKVYFFGWKV